MRRAINLKKGLNLSLAGGLTSTEVSSTVRPSRVAIVPDDFPGFQPKTEVAEGDKVLKGQAILHDKADPEIKLVSPAEGTIESIVRGARRKIERVVISTSKSSDKTYERDKPSDAESLRSLLKKSGLWAMMRQRPYDIIPNPEATPRDIFVTAMDTAPLAPDLELYAEGKTDEIKSAVKAMSHLTNGHIYIGVKRGSRLAEIPGAEIIEFTPLHPAGNAGVQAANISPVNKGETIWTLDIITLIKIGGLLNNGHVDFDVDVALTGSEIIERKMVKTTIGADLKELLQDDIANDGRSHRIISGNVLTGVPEDIGGYLRYPYRQVTVIPEGSDVDEFMGWASMNPSKMSVSPSFIGHFLNKKFNPDARLQGGRRAMIMSGIYDKYLPMDIMPEYLIKAILAKDIDQMEALGIYEIAPEDLALAEYADPSKLELQRIVRDGLDYLRSEV